MDDKIHDLCQVEYQDPHLYQISYKIVHGQVWRKSIRDT